MTTIQETRQTLEKLYRLRDLLLQERGAVILDDLLPHQHPPEGTPSEDWDGWIIQGGRGSGKTAGIVDYVTKHVEGPPCIAGPMPHKMALIAPTLGDADESAERHPVSLKSVRPDFRVTTSKEGTVGKWPNGSAIKLFGTNTRRDVDRLRAGGNNCLVWVEELAAWPLLGVGSTTSDDGALEFAEYDPFAMMELGLRLGPHPHWVGSTTPKAYPAYRQIINDPRVVKTHGTMHDNPYLVQSYKDRVVRRYGGTALGAQEIDGVLLDEVRGALWTIKLIESNRIGREPEMSRVVVGVDPSGGRDTVGIVAAGKVTRDCVCGDESNLPHAVVLGDWSDTTGSPDRWGAETVKAYDQTKADRVVGEANFGGDMVESTIRTKRSHISYRGVHASRGKAIRAEPIVALYEQNRVHHLGRFPEMETEMVTWVPGESSWSPNRLDALVWAITELSLSGPSTGSAVTAPGR